MKNSILKLKHLQECLNYNSYWPKLFCEHFPGVILNTGFTCYVNFTCCVYFRTIDGEIVRILRQRRLECEHFYGPTDAPRRCEKVMSDYEAASTNYFIKCKILEGMLLTKG